MIAYLDLPSGLSGDMLLGCLVDAGLPVEQLQALPRRLNLDAHACHVAARSVHKGAIRATLVTVTTAGDQPHRGLGDVCRILDAADLPDGVRAGSAAVFRRLAEAEARVHGSTTERVHFHEVGALDAIVDITGAVLGLHELGIEHVYAAAPPLGDGWVDTAHGRLPLPAPATLELLAAVGAPTRRAPGPGEWLTPTAAALLAQFARFEQPPMRLERIGYGAGQRDAAWPNVARLWLGRPGETSAPLVELQTNIDDMNPQWYASVSDRLFDAGALDVWLVPVQMKKGRPAIVLGVLAPAAREQALADLMLRETTTLGVRVHAVRRHEALRRMATVQTPFGPIGVKLKWLDGQLLGATPEYGDCRALADEHGVPVRAVFEAAMAAAPRAGSVPEPQEPTHETPRLPSLDRSHDGGHGHGEP